jgi:hypothetical protein
MNTTNSNNAILLLLTNVIYRIKTNKGDRPEHEIRKPETDGIKCDDKEFGVIGNPSKTPVRLIPVFCVLRH